MSTSRHWCNCHCLWCTRERLLTSPTRKRWDTLTPRLRVGLVRFVLSMSATAGPDIHDLFQVFPPAPFLRDFDIISADQVPQPYHDLLVHQHHMTVTVEQHHRSLVDVKVLERKRDGDSYARKILLALKSDGRIVQQPIRDAESAKWLAENAEAFESNNADMAKHGLFSDDWRTF